LAGAVVLGNGADLVMAVAPMECDESQDEVSNPE
jgi:hypothetical protein